MKNQQMKIFIIEDSQAILDCLKESLEGDNISVVGITETASEAILFLERQEVDAIIVDISLREGSGIEVLSHLQKKNNHCPILRIVLTNYATSVSRGMCRSLGADYLFDKSLEFEQAINTLKAHASS